MRLRELVVVVGVACLGPACGGDDEATRSPGVVIQRFADAVNAGDWTRACELSVPDDGCERLLRAAFSAPRARLVVAGIDATDSDAEVFFKQAPDGFSATVERRDGDWLVHPEVQVIR